jgi:tRNA modification GTPase
VSKSPGRVSGLFVLYLCVVKPRQDIIVARATPPGAGAIAVLRVSGPGTFLLIDKLLKKSISQEAGHTAHFRALHDEKGLIDEALLTLFKAPGGYTGDDTVEISTHGSGYIVERLMQSICSLGARPADPGEFTLRAFLNGKLDLSQAEAVADLIASDSSASHEAALHQMRGGISNEISSLRTRLIDFAGLVELELDFSEEDVEFARRDDLIHLVLETLQRVQQLMQSFALGNAVKEGIQVVLAGRPNAGKSTLFNLLLEEERAIVSEIAGTTRDSLEDSLVVDGIRFRLIDTAGIREATDTIEQLGIERTYRHLKGGAMALYVFDIASGIPEMLQQDLQDLSGKTRELLAIGNKRDLAPEADEQRWAEAALKGGAAGFLIMSGKDEQDRQRLRQFLYENTAFKAVSGDQTLITNQRHFYSFLKAEQALQRVNEALETGMSGELLAFDLREALAALGEITGEITTDDLLGSIFSKFCIGK